MSPLVNYALALYVRRQRGLAAVASYEAEHGAFTYVELAEVDGLLDAAGVADLRTADLPAKPGSAPRSRRCRVARARERPELHRRGTRHGRAR